MTPTADNTEDIQQVLTELPALKQEVEQFNQKFDNYQKAIQWVVQLAFSLIAAATVTVLSQLCWGNSSHVSSLTLLN